MSATEKYAKSFLKKAESEHEFKEGFQFASRIPSISIPLTIELTDQEKSNIHQLLCDDHQPEKTPKSMVSQHAEQLISITKQIKSISAQSVLLHGERIKQAQDLLADYREGAFTKWLMTTYGNRQSPYNMLRYYEFHQNAPQIARQMIEAAPKKCVYTLASREGDDQKKLELLQDHGNKPQIKFLKEIQRAFPTQETSKRQPQLTSTIESISKLCAKLEDSSKHLSDNDRAGIRKIVQRLQQLEVTASL